jgi:hypothetical protein
VQRFNLDKRSRTKGGEALAIQEQWLALWAHSHCEQLVHDHAIDKTSYIEIMKTNGLVRILGERWDRPAIVADAEIDAIRQVLETGLPVLPHSYLSEGRRIRITRGPLAGVEGVLVRYEPHKGLLVVSVGLLQRSVAVEVDCTMVDPVGQSVATATPASSSTQTAFAVLA